MIDRDKEDLILLTEARNNIPGRGRVSLATLHRWRTRGFRGTKLECVRVGLFWKTSLEALNRFIDALNAPTVATAMPQQQSKSNDAAKERLRQMGILRDA